MNINDYPGTEGSIAIIGMAGRFPGARNINEFWKNIKSGSESISFFTKNELKDENIDAALLDDPSYVRAKGVLDGAELFDASFFGFSPREAEVTSPQHRIFLESAWEAIENAGYFAEKYQGRIGVYAGEGPISYISNIYSNKDIINSVSSMQVLIGNDKDYLATQVSYKLNLKGPAITIQTACSTSLVAVCMACQALLDYQCDMALAGGVNVAIPQKAGYFYREGGVASPDGHCRAFDAKAQGTVGGSGVGVVVLKRLEDALTDGDHINAVIRGWAVNNDGYSKIGYTASSINGQAEVIAEALSLADINPETIGYIETHGTGTILGDPVEIAALTEVYSNNTDRKAFCALGSLKPNIGHLDTAAGIAGLIKAVLAVKHGCIPPSINFESPNPRINFESSPFYVNDRLLEWETREHPRRAGVSSFGIGGTNAHVILEEAPIIHVDDKTSQWHLLMLSAKTETALDTMVQNLKTYLREHMNIRLSDVAYTLQNGRKNFNFRKALVCETVEDAINILSSVDSESVCSGKCEFSNYPIVFMFPGLGSQYANMARGLYESNYIFREQVDLCSEILKPYIGCDICDIIYPHNVQKQEAEKLLSCILWGRPALFTIEYSLARMWMNLGVVPNTIIGYGVGEYVAACLSGIFSLEDSLMLVSEQEKLQEKLQDAGVSGGDVCTALKSVSDEYKKILKRVKIGELKVPFLSNITSMLITHTEAASSDYWVLHLSNSLQSGDGIQEFVKQPGSIILEVGPGHTLAVLAEHQLNKSDNSVVLPSICYPGEETNELAFLLNTLGKLWTYGININWSKIHTDEKNYRIPLPRYPFERQYYWVGTRKKEKRENEYQSSIYKKSNIQDWFYMPSWKPSILPQIEFLRKSGNVSWIVFMDECGLGSRIIEKINKSGERSIKVLPGEKFCDNGNDVYVINPGCKDDYRMLLEKVCERGEFPYRVIHLWSVTMTDKQGWGVESFIKAQSTGFYSILYLTQSLDRYGITKPLQFFVVSNGTQTVNGEELLCPEKVTLLGACRVISQEYINISCRSIDIKLPQHGSWKEEEMVNSLLAEFMANEVEYSVAYRGMRRFVQAYEPVRLNMTGKPVIHFKSGGVYIITGGLGEIGLLLAEYLVKSLNIKLALIGRSTFPESTVWEQWIDTYGEDNRISLRIRRLQKLKEMGSEVIIFSSDVSDEKALGEIVEVIEKEFGRICGVIHAAGVVGKSGMSSIRDIDYDKCELHFRAKVYSLYVLEKLFKNRNLDFCIMMSSLAAVLGGLGFAAYSAANLFMDAFSYAKKQFGPVPWISINWDGWNFKDSGATMGGPGEELISLAMSPYDGVEAFERVLASGVTTPVIVSTGDLETRIRQWVRHENLVRFDERDRTKSLGNKINMEGNNLIFEGELEEKIADIWKEILGLSKIGEDDNFFDLGGHSLLATQLIYRIRSSLKVDISLADFFACPTIQGMARAAGVQKNTGEKDQPQIIPVQEKEYYNVSFAQKRLYILNQTQDIGTSYNISNVYLIEGVLDAKRLEKAFETLVERHQAFRTSFGIINGTIIQRIHKDIHFKISFMQHDEVGVEDIIQQFIRPFDLSMAPLLRVALIKINENKHILVCDIHHIISDGISTAILVKELLSLYEGRGLPDIKIQYKDFSEWQNMLFETGSLLKQEEYWLNRLSGDLQMLNMPIDYPRPQVQNFEGNYIRFNFGEEMVDAVKNIEKDTGTTLFMYILAIYYIMLSKYTGQEDLIIGTPIAGRPHTDLYSTIGMFVNVLPMRNFPSRDKTFREFLYEVKASSLEAYKNQDYPFSELVDKLKASRDLSRNPLFDASFILQNTGIPDVKTFNGLKFSPYKYKSYTTNSDILLEATEIENDIIFNLIYCSRLFKQETMERMAKCFVDIVRETSMEPDKRLSDIVIISADDQSRVLTDFNEDLE